MPRVKLNIPSTFLYSFDLEIRVDDLNYGQHLSNEMILVYAQQTRIQWLQSLDYSELSIEGKSIIQGDASIVYLSEGHLNDKLKISLFLGEIGNASFELYYSLQKKESKTLLAKAKTGIIFYDYVSKKTQEIPEKFRQKLLDAKAGLSN